MKNLLSAFLYHGFYFFLLVCLITSRGFADDSSGLIMATDVYKFTLHLNVPQVFDNSQSSGYRKYQRQTITGEMLIRWIDDGSFRIDFNNLYNKKFKVGGQNVTYVGYEDSNIVLSRYTYIGSNKTGLFVKPSICFYLELEPSYSKGGNTEDNSFYLLLAGEGKSVFKKSMKVRVGEYLRGYASGTQGCGCAAYTHKSPTRKATICGPMDEVSDVVATYGHWSAMWQNRISCGGAIICR